MKTAGTESKLGDLSSAPGMLTVVKFVAGAVMLATLAACSDRSPVTPDDTTGADVYEANPAGTLLRGDAASPAWDVIGNMLPSPAPSDEVIDGFLTTRLTGVVAASATVGELNQVLEDHDVRIVSMTPHSPVVSLVIPAVLDAAEAETIAAQLSAADAFAFAYPVREAQSSVIDEPIPGAAARPASANPQHLQLTRMHAAWNAKALALENSSLVTVIVPDHYYMDFPILQIDAQNFPVLGNVDEENSPYGNLGFIHTGILGANPDAPGSPGAHPLPKELLQIWSLPIAGLSWVEIANFLGGSSLGALISTNVDHLVISSSLDYGDPLFDNVSLAQRAIDALAWRLALTGQVSTSPTFHLTSAGAAVNETPAAFASPFALQAENADLPQVVLDFDPDGDPAGLANLQSLWPSLPAEAKSIQGNTAIVGSSAPDGEPSSFSPILSHLRMPGSNVPGPCVVPNFLCEDGVELANGSGAATPQAAALAAYLWNLSPNLSNLGIFNNVVTAFGGNSTPGFADCYAAVLALDPNLLDARVRRTVLDLDENGQFDHLDLIEYVGAFDLETPNLRYDLNGDGAVGGPGTAWFDLDVNGDNPSYTDVILDLGCEKKTFDEKGVTDRDILVFYAYSGLYAGDTSQRNSVLGFCPETAFVMEIDFPGSIVEGVDAPLDIRTGFQLGNEEPEWVSGINISIEAVGGTVTDNADTTNVAGFFHTSAQLAPGSQSIELTVTATHNLGIILGEEKVTANRAGQIILEDLLAIVAIDDTGKRFEAPSDLPINETFTDTDTEFCAGTVHLDLRVETAADTLSVIAGSSSTVNAGGLCSNNVFELTLRVESGLFHYQFDYDFEGTGNRLGLFVGSSNGQGIECSDQGGNCPEESPGSGILNPGTYTIQGKTHRAGSYQFKMTLVPAALERRPARAS